jgi:hypothetical protein
MGEQPNRLSRARVGWEIAQFAVQFVALVLTVLTFWR